MASLGFSVSSWILAARLPSSFLTYRTFSAHKSKSANSHPGISVSYPVPGGLNILGTTFVFIYIWVLWWNNTEIPGFPAAMECEIADERTHRQTRHLSFCRFQRQYTVLEPEMVVTTEVLSINVAMEGSSQQCPPFNYLSQSSLGVRSLPKSDPSWQHPWRWENSSSASDFCRRCWSRLSAARQCQRYLAQSHAVSIHRESSVVFARQRTQHFWTCNFHMFIRKRMPWWLPVPSISLLAWRIDLTGKYPQPWLFTNGHLSHNWISMFD